MKFFVTVALAAMASAHPATHAKRVPEPVPGKTIFNIGQNYLNEWTDFAEGTNTTPSGISVYGNIYIGELTADAMQLIESYAQTHPGGIAHIGLSWKDDMTSLGGYSMFEGAKLQHDIAAGRWDEGLNKLGDYLAQFDLQYMLRPDYEVTGNQHANTNPNQFDSTTFDRTAYPAAFRHVAENLSGKLDSIQYIYHPMRGNAELLYPGDDIVDFQGISLFNQDTCWNVAQLPHYCSSGNDLLDPNARMDLEWATKPIVVSESGSQPPYSENAEGSIAFLERLTTIIEEYDVAYWFWINSNWPAHGWPSDVWGDTRIEAKPEVAQWFADNIVANERYVFA